MARLSRRPNQDCNCETSLRATMSLRSRRAGCDVKRDRKQKMLKVFSHLMLQIVHREFSIHLGIVLELPPLPSLTIPAFFDRLTESSHTSEAIDLSYKR